MAKDWLFSDDGAKTLCNFRVAGVLVRDGRLLVQRERFGDEYALPGGHVQVGEEAAQALAREYREELGLEILRPRMLWSEECFWTWNGRLTHAIAFYFKIDVANADLLPPPGSFVPQRDNGGVVVGWAPLSSLKEMILYPEFVKEAVYCMDEGPRHFVTRG